MDHIDRKKMDTPAGASVDRVVSACNIAGEVARRAGLGSDAIEKAQTQAIGLAAAQEASISRSQVIEVTRIGDLARDMFPAIKL